MRVFMIPTSITESTEAETIPQQVLQSIQIIDVFFVENIRTSRRYISVLMKLLPEDLRRAIEDLHFELVDKNTSESEIRNYFDLYSAHNNVGVLSESGCPGIADPGSLIAKIAHQHGYKVIPLTGPSSIFLALMASGMNGQNFVFHGYLPIEEKQLRKKIQNLELNAIKLNQTQIFIETPFRNQRLYDFLLKTCNDNTRLCIATDITGSHEYIKTQSISQWQKSSNSLQKIPTVFLLI